MAAGPYRSGFVSLTGRPNVGKSTLLNRMVGQKIAITSAKPQTTRNRILGVLSMEEAQLVFLDTPGIHRPKHKLGEYMVNLARRCLREVDVVAFVEDCSSDPGGGDKYILDWLRDLATPVILILNKVDLVNKARVAEMITIWTSYRDFADVVPVSALTGGNIITLIQVLASHLPEGPRYYPPDTVTDQPEQVIIAETVREKVLKLTREEVPYAVAVQVNQFLERSSGVVYIGCDIIVERDSQKAILIGRGGQMLKEVGRLAREEIEGWLAPRVFLELWVKVKKDWRQRSGDLRSLGYDPNRL